MPPMSRAGPRALVALHWQRSGGATSPSTLSTCRPQPLNEGLPQSLHVILWHMVPSLVALHHFVHTVGQKPIHHLRMSPDERHDLRVARGLGDHQPCRCVLDAHINLVRILE